MEKMSRPNETVAEHLSNVANECSRMCGEFGMKHIGYITGLFHDAYKDSDAWQNYFNEKLNNGVCAKKVTHAPESAVYLAWRLGRALDDARKACVFSEFIGNCIVSHHGGLHDMHYTDDTYINKINSVYFDSSKKLSFADTKDEVKLRTGMDFESIDDALFDSAFGKESIDGMIEEFDMIEKSVNVETSGNGEFYLRMIFSCLVDADRLDAERHDEGGDDKHEKRYDHDDMNTILGMLNDKLNAMSSDESSHEAINMLRTAVRNEVESHANERKGIYSLILPTGAGKTLAGISFALNHAVHHNMNRVIVTAPLTTVVDQTAMTYTGMFTDKNVIEHQSDFDVLEKVNSSTGKTTKGFIHDESEIEERLALSIENWDVPVVVTTTVQFFESLLQHMSGRSRKIHNIANSVIIIDEEQQLPVEKLYALTNAINILVKYFGCTVVRSTATMPAFNGEIKINNKLTVHGYDETIPLVSDADVLFEKFKRIEYFNLEKKTSDEIAEFISNDEQSVLCVVNTRKKCHALYNKLNKQDGDKYMLSKDICPKNRKKIINEIASRLKDRDPITVVATSIVEAGVDFDFDVALREMNSLYSIKQTGGRCNRNGRHSIGKAYMFEFSDMEISSMENGYQESIITKNCLDKYKQIPKDMSENELCEKYSKNYLRENGKKIDDSRRNYTIKILSKTTSDELKPLKRRLSFFNFAEYGSSFHMIEEKQVKFPVVVKYRDGDDDIDDIIREAECHFSKKTSKKLQQYVVEVNAGTAKKLYEKGIITELKSNGNGLGIYVMDEFTPSGTRTYKNDYGIAIDDIENETMIF